MLFFHYLVEAGRLAWGRSAVKSLESVSVGAPNDQTAVERVVFLRFPSFSLVCSHEQIRDSFTSTPCARATLTAAAKTNFRRVDQTPAGATGTALGHDARALSMKEGRVQNKLNEWRFYFGRMSIIKETAKSRVVQQTHLTLPIGDFSARILPPLLCFYCQCTTRVSAPVSRVSLLVLHTMPRA